eukprot:1148948-Pelagomonas_calceolata.AAC.3
MHWGAVSGVQVASTHHAPHAELPACLQVPVPQELRRWLCPQGVHMLQQYVGVVRAALDRVMGMQVRLNGNKEVAQVCLNGCWCGGGFVHAAEGEKKKKRGTRAM